MPASANKKPPSIVRRRFSRLQFADNSRRKRNGGEDEDGEEDGGEDGGENEGEDGGNGYKKRWG